MSPAHDAQGWRYTAMSGRCGEIPKEARRHDVRTRRSATVDRTIIAAEARTIHHAILYVGGRRGPRYTGTHANGSKQCPGTSSARGFRGKGIRSVRDVVLATARNGVKGLKGVAGGAAAGVCCDAVATGGNAPKHAAQLTPRANGQAAMRREECGGGRNDVW